MNSTSATQKPGLCVSRDRSEWGQGSARTVGTPALYPEKPALVPTSLQDRSQGPCPPLQTSTSSSPSVQCHPHQTPWEGALD